MSNILARDIPEDLIDIINKILIYEEKAKKDNIDDFQYEYAYDYVDERYIEKPKEDTQTIIKISL